jgi:hypothetical protein
MPRGALLSVIVLLPLVGIGGFVGASWSTHQIEPGSVPTVDPYALHLSVNASALPETRIEEPF